MDLLPATSESYTSDLAADRSGNAMVVWSEWTGASTVVMYKQFRTGSGWQPSQSLGNGDGASVVSVSASATGDYFAAWTWYNGTGNTVTFRRYTADWGWSVQRNLTLLPIDSTTMDTAMDGAGNAYMIMNGWNGTSSQTYAARVTPALSVQGPQLMGNASNTTYNPSVAASRATGAWFGWDEYNATNEDAYVARHTGASFTTATAVDQSPDYSYGGVIGVDDFGRAMAVWEQYTNYQYVIRYSQWNGAWSAPGTVYSAANSYGLSLRVTPAGAATVLFLEFPGIEEFESVLRWYPGDGTWTGYSRNAENGTSWYTYPKLAVDTGGNPIVVYQRQAGTAYPLRAAQVSGTNWAARTYLQEDNLSAANQTNPRVEVLAGGAALVTWHQYTGTKWVLRANIYHPIDVTPPWVRIATPLTGDVSSTPSITVTGWADPTAVVVTVNGAPATVGPDGYFVAVVPVAEGWSYFGATANDAAGNYGYSNGRMAFYQNPAHTRDAERSSAGIAGPQITAPLDELNYWGAWSPRIKTAPNGVAYAVWYEYVYPTNQMYLSRYTPGGGWETPIHLAGEEGGAYGGPELAMDAGGNLTVMWGTADPNGQWNHVYAFHYMAAGWWWSPYRVDTADRWGFWPDVAASPNGWTLMVWDQRDEATQKYNTMVRWWDPVNYTISSPLVIENITNSTDGPRVAFDGAGNANVVARVWDATTSNPTNLALIRYRTSTGWDNGTILANTTSPATFGFIDTDRGGNTTVAWLRLIGGAYYQLNTGRFWANQTWSGTRLLWNDSWSWDPEVMAVDNGYAIIAETATVNGTPDALVAAIAPGQVFASMARMDNTTGWGGGPKVSKGYADGTVKAHWDENEPSGWRANMRSYNFTTGLWSANTRLDTEDRAGNLPDLGPMPDGGFMGIWMEYNASMGSHQVVGRRFTPPDVTPPSLTVTTPANGSTVNTSTVRVAGTTEPGRPVLINGLAVWVEANGSFAVDVALLNGTNVIRASSWDQYGNTVWVNRTVTYDNPDRRRIDQLEAQNAALQAQLNLTNSSLWQALAGQNASLLAALAAQNSQLTNALQSGDAALLAQLLAQNASLVSVINGLNQSLLASLASQNASLVNTINGLNSSLLASLASQNTALTNLIANTNTTLLAQLAAQNSDLLQKIASTNTTLFAALATQNTNLLGQLGNLNASLLASMAAGDASLTAQIAATDASLLASLAAQNSTLMDAIAATNSSLLAKLALTNATLWAKLMADNGALWAELNLSAAETAAVASTAASTKSGLDTTNLTVKDQKDALANTRQDLSATTSTAQGASTMSLLGLAVAGAALLVGLVALTMWRKNKPQHTMLVTETPPPVGQVTVPQHPAPAPKSNEDDML